MPTSHETGFLYEFTGDTGGFSFLSLLPAPHSVTAMPLATPPPLPRNFLASIFTKQIKWTFARREQETSAPPPFSVRIHAPVFVFRSAQSSQRAEVQQPGAAGLLHEIFRKLFAWRGIKACGSSRQRCRGDSATVATSPRNYPHPSFTMSCLLALAACGKSQGERRKRRDKHNASETR